MEGGKKRQNNLCSFLERNDPSPNITLHPVWEGKFGASQVRLICTLSGLLTDKSNVEWQQDDKPLNIVPIQRKLQVVGEEQAFSLSSQIEPNKSEWENGSSFTCKATHDGQELMKTINICQSKYVYCFTAQYEDCCYDCCKKKLHGTIN